MDNPIDFDTHRSLAELEGGDWRFEIDEYDAPPHAFALATKPVRRLTPGELLQLIRWGVSLRFTVPLAIARMEGDPFMKAAAHEGDLIVALLEADVAFWKDRRDLWDTMAALLAEAIGQVAARAAEEGEDDEEPFLPQFLGDDFMAAVMHFREIHA